MLAMLVVGLVVLVVIVLFFKGGLGEIGKKFGERSGEVKGQTGTVTSQMDAAVSQSGGLYMYCNSSKSLSNCVTAGGLCKSSADCAAAGGYVETGYGTPTAGGCLSLRICCCTGFGP